MDILELIIGGNLALKGELDQKDQQIAKSSKIQRNINAKNIEKRKKLESDVLNLSIVCRALLTYIKNSPDFDEAKFNNIIAEIRAMDNK